MFDCANVEMRELLPELAAGTLDAGTRARVEQHVASCAECASELDTLRLVRSAYAITPAVDVRKIVSALPNAVPTPRVAPTPQSVKRWLDWRVAAALTMITVGGLSLAVTQRWNSRSSVRDSTSAFSPVDSGTRRIAVVPTPGDTHPTRPDTNKAGGPTRRTTTPSAKVQLAFAGGVEEMDDTQIKALLGALDEIDRAQLAPSAEPDPTPVLPAIRTGAR
jgi:putative zinc finger protein